MFRIRQIAEAALPVDRRILSEVQALLLRRLPGVHPSEVESLPEKLLDPLKYKRRTFLLVADDLRGDLKAFALFSHYPDLGFCVLDYIASDAGGGVGGALYERVRELARGLAPLGLFFECLPDEPGLVSNPEFVKGNASRLRFYERFGARPIVGTGYEKLPPRPQDTDLPFLVWDDLGRGKPLRRDELRAVVRALLERVYARICTPEYVQRVVDSIGDDPVRLRAPRYQPRAAPAQTRLRGERLVALVVNDQHQLHHVRERGYVEAPVRIKSILEGVRPTGLFWPLPPRRFPERHLLAVHEREMVEYLKRACAGLKPGDSIYPYVFPIRNVARPPKDLAMRAGYYCIDTFTPINKEAYEAARRGVDCALTAAEALLSGQRFAYALVRPPGHHAERRSFGGFCYFNNNAVAAEYLSSHGRVAILDLDYHHGNGQQEIFWRRADVLTISIHGHPSFAYPFFTGFEEERGEGEGAGHNLNLPLPEKVDGQKYRRALRQALERIRAHQPRFLVVALGLDTAKRDPTGTWSLDGADFEHNGRLVGELGLPTLVVQEGGYRTASLGSNARRFFQGLTGLGSGVLRRPGQGGNGNDKGGGSTGSSSGSTSGRTSSSSSSSASGSASGSRSGVSARNPRGNGNQRGKSGAGGGA